MSQEEKNIQFRVIIGWILFAIGVLLSVISLAAEYLGLDLTPGFGMVQMFQLLLGFTCVVGAALIYFYNLRPPDAPRSLQADIGLRLVATGLVFAYVSGLADLLGIGTHEDPSFARPFVGELQIGGIGISIGLICIGLFLYHTSRGNRAISSMEFLVKHENGEPVNEN